MEDANHGAKIEKIELPAKWGLSFLLFAFSIHSANGVCVCVSTSDECSVGQAEKLKLDDVPIFPMKPY